MSRILQGDALEILSNLPDCSVHCCVTSPPYWGLRDYGASGQLGLEATPQEYVANMADVFREVRRVLRDDGTLWLNLGDTYSSGTGWTDEDDKRHKPGRGQNIPSRSGCLPPKNLVGIPWRVAFALQEDGWYLRQDIIWHKPNPMPESVTDRCTKAHEYIFLLAKSERYYYDAGSISEYAKYAGHKVKTNGNQGMCSGYDGHRTRDGFRRGVVIANNRNRRSVWTVATHPFSGAHFATFPPDLIRPCILAGCPEGGTVLDPFFGSGTTGVVATQLGREYLGIELNPEYVELAKKRIIEEGEMTLPLFSHERLGVS